MELFSVMCQPGWKGCLGKNGGGGGGLVAKSFPTLATPWTGACQAPLPMGFSRQEYWSGLPFPSQGDRPNPGIRVSCFAGKFWANFTDWAMREVLCVYMAKFICFLHETITTLLIGYTPIQNAFGIKKIKIKKQNTKTNKRFCQT